MSAEPASADVLAAELAALRASVGDPSFRKMAERSGRISHTTLHEAVKGTRFPSWETTREFVKACGADEEPWRARWAALKGGPAVPEPSAAVESNVVESSAAQRPEVPAVPAAPAGASATDALVDGISVAPPPRRKRLPRRNALVVGAAVVAVLAAVAAFVLPGRLGTPAGDASARVPGDNTKFIADVTVPDGMSVRAGVTVQKVWELENSGNVRWHQRYLQRMDLPPAPGTCVTPDRVLVGDTAPGEHVMISVPVTASDAPGRCWIGWKMVDAAGEEFFTTKRPVYVLITVVP
ncbi:NBR1-Ig-like domain-containing protein [Amycolatopsis rhabdoformis]|uniref:NBR1-Ig-like domain-containing protein n=1 Tax=Amycolatopsis rhabdoformis TaxID=1448059 RepID=A0ABZ1I6W5_9PSEU|nr:NBR1-Ig-like domain-containing protein [Amycolatopsis rhabdoformis]WSE29380.1 NBR1-Ig-like domain-containing protein [Amycolatopsis rhabdoformis]